MFYRINVYSDYIQAKMYVYPYRDIFIHLDISIKLFIFELLYPPENKNDRFSPSFMDCPCTKAHFSQFSQELMDFVFEDIWGKWRHCV